MLLVVERPVSDSIRRLLWGDWLRAGLAERLRLCVHLR